MAHHFGQSPDRLRPEQIVDYWVFLATEKQLAPGSIGIAVSVLRFLDGVTLLRDWDIPDVLPTPRQPRKLPVVPSFDKVGQFLGCAASTKQRAVLTACYAGGLRISATVSLRPADIDSRRMVVRAAQGKGREDRHIMLLPCLLAIFRDCWRRTQNEGEWLFPDLIPGRHLSSSAVEQAWQKVLALSGMAKQISPKAPSVLRGLCVVPGHGVVAGDGDGLPRAENAP